MTSSDDIAVPLRDPWTQVLVVARTAFISTFAVLFGLAAFDVGGVVSRLPVLAAVLCAALLLSAVLSVVGPWPAAWRRRTLVVSPARVTLRSTADPWQFAWTELRVLFLDVGSVRVPGSQTSFRGTHWRVTLRLRPRDPVAFAAAHPEFSAYRGQSGARDHEWAIRVVEDRRYVRRLTAALDDALRVHGGLVYDGLLRIGKVPGT